MMRARRVTVLFRNRSHVINGLRLVWILSILWFELGIFTWSLRSCSWPDTLWTQPDKSLVSPAHLLVVADTQVLDNHSLSSVTFGLRSLVRSIIDTNLRKSWRATRRLNPHAVLFLGDMINGGRYARDGKEYDAFVAKFKRIFSLSRKVPVYYVVGNHDVGLGHSTQFSTRARSRFESSFHSTPNRVVSFGNHSLVLVDAPGLVEEDYRRVGENKIYPLRSVPASSKGSRSRGVWTPSRGGAMEFVTNLAKERQTQEKPSPIVVFSHIPLARPERSKCGPMRERTGVESYIQKGAGSGYQNLLGKATSTWLLETLEPKAVYSADDHDYCQVTHSYLGQRPGVEEGELLGEWRSARETTVKTFSMGAGIKRPGVQLVSFWNPGLDSSFPKDVELVENTIGDSTPTFADKACLLPNQSRIYTHGYLPLILLSIALLIWLNLKTPRSKLSPMTLGDKSLPFFDETRYDEDDPEVTPRASRGMTSRHTGLRTPVSRGSSSFPSPILSSVLLPPDIDGESDEDDGTSRVDVEYSARSVPATPITPVSGKWEVGGWRRNSSRSLFGHAAEKEKEKERGKVEGNGWRRVGLQGRGSCTRLVVRGRWWVGLVYDVVLGRTRRGDSLWERCVWDGACVVVTSLVGFWLVMLWFV